MDGRLVKTLSVLLTVFISACAAGPTPSNSGRSDSDSSAASRGPKTLTVALQREPSTFEGFNGQGGSGGGAGDLREMVHNHLTTSDPLDNQHAQLAAELPAVDKGTWQVFADGTMEMSWKLRPGVKWHDGTPFTSADLAFSLQLHKDPALAHAYARQSRVMESATMPDPLTFVVRWSQIDVRALEARALTPMPKHLLEELYQGDKDAFVNSPLFTTEFVGLGPYRLVNWDRGSQLEMVRYDDYFQGRPPFDRVIARIIPDPSAMIANILSESVDVVLPPSVEIDAALDLKRRWEGTGNVVRAEPIPRFVYLELQFRPETARPTNGLTSLAVRQALLHAIDREEIASVMTGGMGPVADSWIRPDDPMRRDIESVIPKFPYDRNRAAQLFAQAGWSPGPGGILVHSQTGERFEMELWNNPQTSDKTAAVLMDSWRAVGVDPKLYIIPPARSEDREHTTQHPGPLLTGTFLDQFLDRYDGRDISAASNRWSGRNRAAYLNPQADALLQRLQTVVDPRERLPLIREHVQIMMTELAYMPLYWEPRAILQLKSVRGDIHPYNSGWNAFTWDKQ